MTNEIKLRCPLCKEVLDYFEGRSNDSGVLYRPSVKCECGFMFQNKTERTVNVGECGWDEIRRTLNDDRKKMVSMLGEKNESND